MFIYSWCYFWMMSINLNVCEIYDFKYIILLNYKIFLFFIYVILLKLFIIIINYNII